MLFVISKEKIMCYIIAFSTVIILMGMAMLKTPYDESLQTIAGVNETNSINNALEY